jgi:hypothetical protein
MTTDSIVERVRQYQPRLIYLSGKTCTGKTTFANYLEQYGYKKVELDKIVTESVVIPFNVAPGDGFRTAYRGLGPAEQTNAFVVAAKQEILNAVQESALVVEGAIADPQILKRVFSGELTDFVFVYFHPVHAEIYEERILSRFVDGAKTGNAGLPKNFWELVQDANLEEFRVTGNVSPGIHAAIKAYAANSMEESKSRLESFQASIPDIAIVEL